MRRVDDQTEPADPNDDEGPGVAPAAAAALPSGVRARVVARIIDPSVREDGLGEPVVSFPSQRRPSEGGEARSEATPEARSSHPVRDRLIARARAADAAKLAATRPKASGAARSASAPSVAPSATPPPPQELEGVIDVDESDFVAEQRDEQVARFESLPELADDLDLIGAPSRSRPVEAARSGPPLAASAALLLGTLFGVTGLAVLFAILIEAAPHAPLVGRAAPETTNAALVPAPAVSLAAPNVTRAARKRVNGPWRISDAKDDAELSSLRGSVGNNSFLGAVQAAGISLREAYRLLKAFDGVKDLNRCRPRDSFSALVKKDTGRLTAFEYSVGAEEVYQAREGPDGLLVGQRLDLQVRRERAQGVIVVSGSFDASAQRAGFEPGLGEVVNKALAGYSSVGEMRDGDVVALVAQEVTALGEFSRYAGVEALEYRPVGNEPVRVYYHATEKARGYVDSKGRVFGKSRWARPVPGAGITSRFNPKRMHPILKIIKPHNGTDFGAPIGTPVVASAFGKVSFVGLAGPNGNMITLSHEGGYETGYSHLSRFVKNLKVGDRVDQKQVIGYVGSTGRSTGPHLHFSAKRSHRFIDPESLNLDAFSRLALSDRQVLGELRQRYDRLLDALPIPEARPIEVAVDTRDRAAPEPSTTSPEVEPSQAAAPAAVTAPALTAIVSGPVVSEKASAASRAEPPVTRAERPSLEPRAPTTALAATRSAPSIYLSDRELMLQQPRVDDGEVDP